MDKLLERELSAARKRNWAGRREVRIALLLRGAKNSARVNGHEFALTAATLLSLWPMDDKCPVFNRPFVHSGVRHPDLPSLDRFDSTRGYTPDNVAIISWRANSLKNNATWEELRALANWARRRHKALN